MTDADPVDVLLNSKLAGAAFRGLTSEAVALPEGEFQYANCLDREYASGPETAYMAVFDISRFGKFKEALKFYPPVSEREAVAAVEAFLSEPLTEEYYARIRADLCFDEAEWAKAKNWYSCRGDCLTDSVFLERVVSLYGVLVFITGS